MTLAHVGVVKNIRTAVEERFNLSIIIPCTLCYKCKTIILGVGRMLLQIEEAVNKINNLKDVLIEIRASL